MILKNTYSDYINYWVEKIGRRNIIQKLNISNSLITNIFHHKLQFSEQKLENFAEICGMDEFELYEIVLQSIIEQYNAPKGKKFLKALKKNLHMVEKLWQGASETELETLEPDPIDTIRACVPRIKDKEMRDLIESALQFGLKHYPHGKETK